MNFPSFDQWLKENIGTGLVFTREELAIAHLNYEKEKLFAEEGIIPDGVHEEHE